MASSSKIQLIKYAPPPPELPVYGRVPPTEVSFIGRTNYVAALEEKKFIFGVKRRDQRRHLYIIGKSGVGKSKLLELMIRQDVAHGYGCCLLDPYGDTVQALLDFIPESRIRDVCLIDPTESSSPLAFNPFAGVAPPFRHQFAQAFIEAIRRSFGGNWTPHIEHLCRFACLALLNRHSAAMPDLLALLTDRAYREAVAADIEDGMVKRFWTDEFAAWSARFEADAVGPLVNKLGQFFSNPFLRQVMGGSENRVDFRSLMRENKIVLVNLATGHIGEAGASFLGSIIVSKLQLAAVERVGADVRDFYVYVDEFQGVATEAFERLFAEAQRCALCMTVAHQYLGQLTAPVRAAMLGNVGSLVIFRVGGQDAAELEAELEPVFKAKDMMNLGMQQFYVKMIIDGDTYDPFSAETLTVLPPPHQSFRDRIISASRERYSIPADAAKQLIAAEEAPTSG